MKTDTSQRADIHRLRRVGLLGGMSWQGSALYYRTINERIRAALGGVASAPLLMESYDFREIAPLFQSEQWDVLGRRLLADARNLVGAGAEAVAICCNTAHAGAEPVERELGLPLLHMGDALAEALGRAGLSRALLLGTRPVMNGAFLRERLERRLGGACLLPDESDQAILHRAIYSEFARGKFTAERRASLAALIARAHDRGADCVVLACTELSLAVSAEDVDLPLFDTAQVHAERIAAHILG